MGRNLSKDLFHSECNQFISSWIIQLELFSNSYFVDTFFIDTKYNHTKKGNYRDAYVSVGQSSKHFVRFFNRLISSSVLQFRFVCCLLNSISGFIHFIAHIDWVHQFGLCFEPLNLRISRNCPNQWRLVTYGFFSYNFGMCNRLKIFQRNKLNVFVEIKFLPTQIFSKKIKRRKIWISHHSSYRIQLNWKKNS